MAPNQIFKGSQQIAKAVHAFSEVKITTCECPSNQLMVSKWCSISTFSSKLTVLDAKSKISPILDASCSANQSGSNCRTRFEKACDEYLVELARSNESANRVHPDSDEDY